VYEARTHGSVRGMMLDMIIQHHPTRLFAQNAFCADGLKEVLTPYQREVNMRSRALLATARSEVRSSVNMEHSASELMLVGRVGNLSKSGKALKLDNSTD